MDGGSQEQIRRMLFDNPLIRNIRQQMTQEQLDEYARIGEYMYNIDFENEFRPILHEVAPSTSLPVSPTGTDGTNPVSKIIPKK